MPILIENVKILHLDGNPSGELGDCIFNSDTQLTIPEYLYVYNETMAIGLAKVTPYGPDLHADVVMYSEVAPPFLGAYALKIFGRIEEVNHNDSNFPIIKYSIEGLILYNTLYKNRLDYRLPTLNTYSWIDTDTLKMSSAG